MAHVIHLQLCCHPPVLSLQSSAEGLSVPCSCQSTGILVLTESAFSQFCSWEWYSGSSFPERVFSVNKAGCYFSPCSGSSAAFSHTHFHLYFIHNSLGSVTNLLKVW